MTDSAMISIRVTPRSSRDEVIGWQENVLLVRLRAAPVEGQANEALCRLLAKHLGIAVSKVEITRGAISRTKRVRVEGVAEAEIRERLTTG